MRRSLLALAVAGICGLAASSHAAVIFSDDFESGTMSNWSTWTGATAMTTSTDQHYDGGVYSAKVSSSTNKVYHNLGTEVAGPSTLTFWLYDDTASTQTRAYGEVRAYSPGSAPTGTLQQLFAIGKYSSITSGSAYDATKYQARALASAIGWFNLDNPGTPGRSTGWHRFDIERLADGTTINYYVDGVVGKTVTNQAAATWDSVSIGSVGAGTTVGNMYFDNVAVTNTLVPEPSAIALLGAGALGLLRRRQRA